MSTTKFINVCLLLALLSTTFCFIGCCDDTFNQLSVTIEKPSKTEICLVYDPFFKERGFCLQEEPTNVTYSKYGFGDDLTESHVDEIKQNILDEFSTISFTIRYVVNGKCRRLEIVRSGT